MLRSSVTVINALLEAKQSTIRDFPSTITDTGNLISELIPGTSFFPGGTGLWRGREYFGPLPEYFPESPIMFIAHNFDSEAGYNSAKVRGGGIQAEWSFWGVLLAYLTHANLHPSNCYFTNALMGLKPGRATGPMPTTQPFEEQCGRFLLRQIQIVQPKFLVTLGGAASKRLSQIHTALPFCQVMHPSAREFKPLVTRESRIKTQSDRILKCLETTKSQLP